MKILAITSTRADWGLLAPVLDALRDDERFELEIVATGHHLMVGSGSLAAIANEGHDIAYQIDMELSDDDSPSHLAQAMGKLVEGMGPVVAASKPDILLVLGDRYEILAAVQAAVVARVPIAHLCGGDVTEGAIDDSIRHAITKLAAVHFPTNEESARRIVQMGEDPGRVHNVGSTGIDRILNLEPMRREDFFEAVELEPGPRNFIITFHPATLSSDSLDQAQNMLDALDAFPDTGLIFTGSNADPGGRDIDVLVRDYVAHRANAIFHDSLGSKRYFSALTYCDVVVGNSSSGILEAPSFKLPTVNIGDRQARRPRAASVIDCPPGRDDIVSAIRKALAIDCVHVESPFGDGHATGQIVETLANVRAPERLARKSFMDRFQ